MTGAGDAGCDDASAWAGTLEAMIARQRGGLIDRVAVVARTESTQDAARRMCGGRAGLMVLAGRQTAGRGRLGRRWADTSHLGVAATFVLPGEAFDDGRLSLVGGIVAMIACEVRPGLVGLRWPNDVVERDAPQRKVAGVLVERVSGLAYLGIGVNVLQRDADWAGELGGRAVSLLGLGASRTRLEVAGALLEALESQGASGPEELARAWRGREVLAGTRRTFVHDNRSFVGEVVAVDPTSSITLRLEDGREVTLPARTTSLVHEAS